MPILDILDKDRGLRWDAPGRLDAAIYFPREQDLREEYAARWRAEHKSLRPAGKRLLQKTTYRPATAFGRRPIRAVLRKRRERIERIGTALWVQAILSKTDPSNATENRTGYMLSELGKEGDIKTSRATIRRDWVMYRGVVHWCAAIAYQRQVFQAPLRFHPDIGPAEYSIYAALFDFLELGEQFFAFAQDSGCFATTKTFQRERDLWTLPAGFRRVVPKRDTTWPDCNRIRATVLPHAAVLEPLDRYNATSYRA